MENMFIYIDREEAKTGVSLVYSVSKDRILNFKELYKDEAIEFYGSNLPHYITYLEESDSIRESTKIEIYEKGFIELESFEFVEDGEIKTFCSYTQKILNGKVVYKVREDYINENLITLESEKEKARNQRKKEFAAYRNCKEADDEEPGGSFINIVEANNWKVEWLHVPNDYVDLLTPIEESFPKMPSSVQVHYDKTFKN